MVPTPIHLIVLALSSLGEPFKGSIMYRNIGLASLAILILIVVIANYAFNEKTQEDNITIIHPPHQIQPMEDHELEHDERGIDDVDYE